MNRLPLLSLLLVVTAACGIDQADVGEDLGTDGAGAGQELSLLKGRFETFKGRDGRHYFHLRAGNGERVLSSQGYSSAAAAAKGVASVQSNGADESSYLKREASDGSPYFVVVAKNGEIIGVSQMYDNASNANRAQDTVAKVVKSTVERTEAVVNNAKFETFKGLDGRYYFHLQAGNGEIVLQSQGYTSRTSANNGIASVQSNGSDPRRYTVRAAADGKSYFVLKAANGAVIARGEAYDSVSNANRGIDACVSLLSSSVQR